MIIYPGQEHFNLSYKTELNISNSVYYRNVMITPNAKIDHCDTH